MKMKRPKIKMKSSVPFLPNFVTTIGLFFGFFSISYSINHNFYWAETNRHLVAINLDIVSRFESGDLNSKSNLKYEIDYRIGIAKSKI